MKWRVYASVRGSKYIGEVEADTKEEAEKLGWEHENCYVSMCHQCSDHCEDPEIDQVFVEEEK